MVPQAPVWTLELTWPQASHRVGQTSSLHLGDEGAETSRLRHLASDHLWDRDMRTHLQQRDPTWRLGHLQSQQRPGVRRNRPVLHPLVQENPSNQTLPILGRLPGNRLLGREDKA